MRKIIKGIAILVLSVTLGMGAVGTSFAAGSISADISDSYISCSFNYGKAGYQLKTNMVFKEKHKTTGQVYGHYKARTVNGNNTSVSDSRKADTGYKYTDLTAYGYVNGNQSAVAGPLKNN